MDPGRDCISLEVVNQLNRTVVITRLRQSSARSQFDGYENDIIYCRCCLKVLWVTSRVHSITPPRERTLGTRLL